MFVDLSIVVSVLASKKALDNEQMVSFGHLGTHFDVMNKEFPLQNIERPGVVFDVSGINDRDIDLRDNTPKDQYCADRGVFIVENLCNLKNLLGDKRQRHFTAHTYPVKFADMSGLPCRVVGEI
ncbi:MAG: hypothetical protein AB1696_26050 [Planctomycetota bacterium]